MDYDWSVADDVVDVRLSCAIGSTERYRRKRIHYGMMMLLSSPDYGKNHLTFLNDI